MTDTPHVGIEQMDDLCARLTSGRQTGYGYAQRLSDRARRGDRRLIKLRYDGSAAALRLWSFLLSENERLRRHRAEGRRLVGTMKDLGTVPVMAYAYPELVAFYPDGAWWVPCIMEMGEGLLDIAADLGLGDALCPVRAMIGAFLNDEHFPRPDLLTCSVGAVCDDFSVVAQRLESLGHPIIWWEMPARRTCAPDDDAIALRRNLHAPRAQVQAVKRELQHLRDALDRLAGRHLSDAELADGVREANRVREVLTALRETVFSAPVAPLPALELLIAEMLALHFCSDREESGKVLQALLDEVRRRVAAGMGTGHPDAVRVYWVNPVADLRAMNVLEECGGRLCGTELLFCHAIDPIREDLDPMEALARAALSDLMAGPVEDRARHIVDEAARLRAEAVVVSRVPGASHCAWEGAVIAEEVRGRLGLPVVEFEIPPVSDAVAAAIRNRLEALMETAKQNRLRGQ